MNLPPNALVRAALLETVLPPVVVAAVVFGLARLFGRRFTPLGSVLALAAGWAAGNHFREIVPWLPDSSSRRVEWLPVLAGAAAVAGLIARYRTVGWALVAALYAFAVPRLLPGEYLKEPWWAVPGFVLLTAAVGHAAERRSRDSTVVPFLMAAALYAAGTVAVHAHSARLLDTAVVAGSAVFGLAVVARLTRSDAGGAMPGAAFVLTGVSLLAHHETADLHAVPAVAFALPAVALLPLLVPLPGRWGRVVQWGLGLLLLAAGVGLAAWHEPLDFENL